MGGRGERVLYVEDDAFLRRAFVHAFADIGIDTAADLAEARARMETDVHLAWVVDERLPDGSGLALVEAVRARGLWTPALLVTGVPDHHIVNRAQLAGVEIAYKPDLTANVRAFFARARSARSASPAVLRAADRYAERYALSPRERDLVRAVGRGVPRAALGRELRLSDNTVKTLVRRILRKTDAQALDDVLRAVLSDGGERADTG